MFKIMYKWVMQQKPAIKNVDHFINSINEKKDKWLELKPELQISPFVYSEDMKKVYYMPIFDIEDLDFYYYYKTDIFNCYCFTGKGIHLFSNKLYEFKNIKKDIKNLKSLQYNSKLDVITTFKITPIRFFNSYSNKYGIWLWYRKKPIKDKSKLYEDATNEEYKTVDEITSEIINFISDLKVVGDIDDFIKKIT